MKITHNILTGEITEETYTAAELKQRKQDREIEQAMFNALQTEAEAKATQKAALLERLGITQDEARLLLS